MFMNKNAVLKRRGSIIKVKKINVMQIMGKWAGGGVENVIMNYYANMDKNRFHFDFVFDEDSINIPFNEIENIGGRVIMVPPYQNFIKYNKELKKIMLNEKYDIVHSNLNTLSVFPLRIAKTVGIKIRIAHSHATSNKKQKKKNLLKQILRPFSKLYANNYFACTELAGRWLFGDKTFEEGKVILINNAIHLDKFVYNEEKRESMRSDLGISDNVIVLGNVGRFVGEKNQMFLLDILQKYKIKHSNVKLLLVGQGKLKASIKRKVSLLNLENEVMLLGQRSDVNDLYQAMDVFLLPSLCEGLGMVLIEAQTSGLPCLASKNVPESAKIIENFEFLDIESNKASDLWCDEIVKKSKNIVRADYSEEVRNAGYDIRIEVKKLEKKYEELIKLYS